MANIPVPKPVLIVSPFVCRTMWPVVISMKIFILPDIYLYFTLQPQTSVSFLTVYMVYHNIDTTIDACSVFVLIWPKKFTCLLGPLHDLLQNLK